MLTGASHLFLGVVCCAQGANYFFMNLVTKVWLLLLFRACSVERDPLPERLFSGRTLKHKGDVTV